jgi:glutamate-1-semialdehyde 2,1-aminomutase
VAAAITGRFNNATARCSDADHVRATARRTGAAVTANCVGPCVQPFAGAQDVPTIAELSRVDRESTLDFTAALLRHGVATLPRGVMYLSTAHTDDDIEVTLDALGEVIASLAKSRPKNSPPAE